MSILSIVTMSDLHLGVLDPQYQIENLREYFFKYCKENKPDIIAINGDIMDERVSVNTTTASVFHMFIDELLELDSIILITEGTKSHDDNQINVFSHRVSNKFKIYSKVYKDTILGLNILFIPEEYMHDPKEYYKDYLNVNDKYDFIFGHGMAKHVAYHSKKKNLFRRLTSPIWDYEEDFKDIVYGAINFGHIHTHSTLDKFSYNGSYGRYNHGEEEDKGFMVYKYDTDKKELLSTEFIINEGAKIFKTIKESDLPSNRDVLLEILEKYSKESYRLRIKFDRNVDKQKQSDIISFCKTSLNTTIDKEYDRKTKKVSIHTDDKAHMLIDNKYENMDIVQATIEFVKENYDVNIDKEYIHKILNSGGD